MVHAWTDGCGPDAEAIREFWGKGGFSLFETRRIAQALVEEAARRSRDEAAYAQKAREALRAARRTLGDSDDASEEDTDDESSCEGDGSDLNDGLHLEQALRGFSGEVVDALLRSGADTFMLPEQLEFAAEWSGSRVAAELVAERSTVAPLSSLARRALRSAMGPGLMVRATELTMADNHEFNASLFYGVAFTIDGRQPGMRRASGVLLPE